MNREMLREHLGLEPTATDVEIVAAARAAKAMARRRASASGSAEAAKAEEDSIAELDAILSACGLAAGGTTASATPPPGGSSSSPLSQSMLRDLPGATPVGSVGGTAGGVAGERVTIEPGRVLADRYEVRRRLGAGGMGAVFAAWDRTKEEEIAIKVVLPELVERKDARERFVQEAKAATSLSHPGIVKVFDVQQDGGLMFLTMELLAGHTLREEIEQRKKKRRPFRIEEVQRIGKALCESLGYAHQKTVHRDVKPENVLLCGDGRQVLMDFGLAKLLSSSALSRSGSTVGTAYYMAPEQQGGASKVDHRADQFAVGVVLYELLTGKVPQGMAQPVKKLRKDVPAGLAAAVQRALATDAKARHSDMASLQKALSSRGPSLSVPKPVLLGVAAAALVAVVGMVFAKDLSAAFQRWRRDPMLVAAVEKQRQAVLAQHAGLVDLAANLERSLAASFTTAHDQALRDVANATAAEDDSLAKQLLDDAAARCERQKAELLAAGTSDLAGKLAQLERWQKQLEDRGREIEGEPLRLLQQLERQQSLLDGGRLESNRVAEVRSLKAKATMDHAVAQAAAQMWRERADGLLADLAQTIGAAKPALSSGKGDVVAAAASLRRGIEIAQRLDTLVKEVPPLMRRVDELQRLRSVTLKSQVEAVPPAVAAVDGWLAASRRLLAAEDYKATRQKLEDLIWLLDAKRLQDWARMRWETKDLLDKWKTLPKPKNATDAGPVAWLSEQQRQVEARVAAADRAADFAGWSATLEAGRGLAAVDETRKQVEKDLDDERKAASGTVPTGVWDALQGVRAELLLAIWQRDRQRASRSLEAIQATQSDRTKWLELAKDVVAVRNTVVSVRQQGPAQAAEQELVALSKRFAIPQATPAELRKAMFVTLDAAARAYVAWAGSQPIGRDAAIGQQIEEMKGWSLSPATMAAVEREAAAMKKRLRQREECESLSAQLRRSSEAARFEALDRERRMDTCTRARFEEVVGEMRLLLSAVESARVSDLLNKKQDLLRRRAELEKQISVIEQNPVYIDLNEQLERKERDLGRLEELCDRLVDRLTGEEDEGRREQIKLELSRAEERLERECTRRDKIWERLFDFRLVEELKSKLADLNSELSNLK